MARLSDEQKMLEKAVDDLLDVRENIKDYYETHKPENAVEQSQRKEIINRIESAISRCGMLIRYIKAKNFKFMVYNPEDGKVRSASRSEVVKMLYDDDVMEILKEYD